MKVDDRWVPWRVCLTESSDKLRSRVPDIAHVWKSSQGADDPQINWDEFDDCWDDDTDEEQVWEYVWKEDGVNGGESQLLCVGHLEAANGKRAPFSGTAYLPPPPTGLATYHHTRKANELTPRTPIKSQLTASSPAFSIHQRLSSPLLQSGPCTFEGF